MLVTALFLLLLVSYALINRYNSTAGRDLAVLKWGVDDLTPFCPYMIYFYVSWYLQLALLAWHIWCNPTAKATHHFKLMVGISSLGMALAQVIFIVYPTWCSRENVDLSGVDPLTVLIFNRLHSADAPTNCWPSSHVLVSALFAFYYTYYLVSTRLYGRGKTVVLCVLVWIWSIGIWLSTVFIKQHFWPDVVGGLVIAGLVILFERLYQCRRSRRIEHNVL